MKNFYIAAVLTAIGLTSLAQEADKFRVGLEIGVAIPKGGRRGSFHIRA